MTPELWLLPPLGHDGSIYAGLAAALDGTLRVRTLEYPGFGGRPDDLDWEAPELLARLVDDALAQLHAQHARPWGLGGISLGGTLSLPLALRFERPARVLMASGGLPVARIRRELLTAAMQELGEQGFVRRHFGLDHPELERSSQRAHFGRIDAATRAYHAHYHDQIWGEACFARRARAAVAMLRAALEADYREALAGAGPTLLIAGEADRLFGERRVARLARHLPGARLQRLPGVGHYPPLEAPAEVAALIAGLLRGGEP